MTTAAGEADGLASVSGTGLISPTLSTSISSGMILGNGTPIGLPAVILTSHLTMGLASTVTWGHILTQAMKLGASVSSGAKYGVTLSDLQKLTGQVHAAFAVSISGGVSFSTARTVALGLTVLSRLRIAPQTVSATGYGVLLAQALIAGGAAQAFFSQSLEDGVVLSSRELVNYIGSPSVSDGVTISRSFAPQFVFSATAAEELDLTDAQLLKTLFAGTISDEIDLRAIYVSPAGETTTWVMNTRTNALTEYRNWSFNSFAMNGPNKYIAADQTGLYELDGERDFGQNIQSIIRSGYMQWNASRLSGLKAVYLGMRTDTGGDFVFKLIGGDGQEYAYSVKANPNLMTTKIDIGKGLRTRYFAFELDGLGADWNLDTVEFVPLMQQRRI